MELFHSRGVVFAKQIKSQQNQSKRKDRVFIHGNDAFPLDWVPDRILHFRQMDDILQAASQYRKKPYKTAVLQAPVLHTRCMKDKTCTFRAA
jgi:hypothetical protein